jgi:DNA polymerase elongation subunit (family B)
VLKRLFFDIETVKNDPKLVLMPEPTAPGNIKDPEKIAIAIKEKKEDQIANAPLDSDYGRVFCIGFAMNPDDEPEVLYGDEKTMLSAFWRLLNQCDGRCVGYNVLYFDIPFLLKRSMDLGVRVGTPPFLAKFRMEPVTDLFGVLYNWDKGKGLKVVAKLYDLHNDMPDVTGADVANLPTESIVQYCASDVSLVQQLYTKMQGVYFNLG